MTKKYDRDALLADYHTGQYSQRELAKKHGVSNGTVANLTKGLSKKNEHLVNSKVQVIQETVKLSEQELSAVEHSVQFKLSLLKDVERFTDEAIKKANSLIQESDSGSDFKATIEGVDRLTVMTRLNARHAQAAVVQQNNNTLVADKLSELSQRLPH